MLHKRLLAGLLFVWLLVLTGIGAAEGTPGTPPAGNDGPVIERDVLRFNVINTHAIETTERTMTKVWDDRDDLEGQRGSYTVQLYADGQPCGAPVTLSKDQTTYTWTQLPMNDQGTPIVYTVDETGVPMGYVKQVEDFTITNRYAQEYRELTVSKIWNDGDDQDGKRPAKVTVRLYADGTEVAHATLSAAEGWSHTFTSLPVYSVVPAAVLDADAEWSLGELEQGGGKKITYTVTEDAVSGYTCAISTDAEGNVTLTNLHKPVTVDIPVTKRWRDQNNRYGSRPEVIGVTLLAGGEEVGSQTMDAASGWKTTFTDVPLYKDGKRILYTLEEGPVKGYRSEITGSETQGYVVTNIQLYYYDFTFEKKWEGVTGEHPEPTFVLYNPDGTVHRSGDQPPVKHPDGNYVYSLNNGDDYYVIEEPMEGYTTVYINVGQRKDFTDRCFVGGTIVNIKDPVIPETGDDTPIELYLLLFAGAALLLMLLVRKEYRLVRSRKG